MRVPEPRYRKEEFARRGDEIYHRAIGPRVGPEDEGKFVVIDIETGAYEIDQDELAASDRLLARKLDAQVWTVAWDPVMLGGLGLTTGRMVDDDRSCQCIP